MNTHPKNKFAQSIPVMKNQPLIAGVRAGLLALALCGLCGCDKTKQSADKPGTSRANTPDKRASAAKPRKDVAPTPVSPAESRAQIDAARMAFYQARAKNDAATMGAQIAELEKLDAASPGLPIMKLDLLIANKDWAAALKQIEDMADGNNRGAEVTANMIASKIHAGRDAEYPEDFVKAVSKAYAALLANQPTTAPMNYVTLTILQWKGGDKQAATVSANMAAEIAATQAAARGSVNLPQGIPQPLVPPAAPFERFAKAVAEGTLPSRQEWTSWLHEAMPRLQVPPPAPVPAVEPSVPAPE